MNKKYIQQNYKNYFGIEDSKLLKGDKLIIEWAIELCKRQDYYSNVCFSTIMNAYNTARYHFKTPYLTKKQIKKHCNSPNFDLYFETVKSFFVSEYNSKTKMTRYNLPILRHITQNNQSKQI